MVEGKMGRREGRVNLIKIDKIRVPARQAAGTYTGSGKTCPAGELQGPLAAENPGDRLLHVVEPFFPGRSNARGKLEC